MISSCRLVPELRVHHVRKGPCLPAPTSPHFPEPWPQPWCPTAPRPPLTEQYPTWQTLSVDRSTASPPFFLANRSLVFAQQLSRKPQKTIALIQPRKSQFLLLATGEEMILWPNSEQGVRIGTLLGTSWYERKCFGKVSFKLTLFLPAWDTLMWGHKAWHYNCHLVTTGWQI